MSRPAGGMDDMLKVAIVGCGKIADSHAIADPEDRRVRDRWGV